MLNVKTQAHIMLSLIYYISSNHGFGKTCFFCVYLDNRARFSYKILYTVTRR
jgi:hypothetical protein